MSRASVNGIEIEYDTFGAREDEPLLLIMGLGAQMIWWEEDFCRALAGLGLCVIRFDNRDVGLSTKFSGLAPENFGRSLSASLKGETYEPPYRLEDMAADAFGLLDHLGYERAHVLGASMGGMIAQVMAVTRPERILSLISVMSTTGNPDLAAGGPAVKLVYKAPPRERDKYIDYQAGLWRQIGSPGFPRHEAWLRAMVARDYDRCFHPEGVGRQLLALLASGNRRPALAGVTAPTLVIHGSDDPLAPVSGGRDTAEAIPGAELLIIEGMGHDFPPEVWPVVVDAVGRTVRRTRLVK